MTALLSVRGLTAYYGASQALFGVDMSVDQGQLVALMGRNGMGKTTTIHSVCRMMRRGDGAITFNGTDLNALRAHQAARLGLGLVPEGRRCFPNLSVKENLTAAARPGDWDLSKIGRLFPRLEERLYQNAASLSGGEQQMLAIGRALMTNPRLLVLDEATEGLAPTVRTEIWAAIRELKATGLAILAVDKSLKDLTAMADACIILERGTTVWTGAPQDLNPDIAQRYLGV
ncbi:MAG: ABC transporter ATP-binding protein [Pseudomonadota bacterium]